MLAALAAKATQLTWTQFWTTVTAPLALADDQGSG